MQPASQQSTDAFQWKWRRALSRRLIDNSLASSPAVSETRVPVNNPCNARAICGICCQTVGLAPFMFVMAMRCESFVVSTYRCYVHPISSRSKDQEAPAQSFALAANLALLTDTEQSCRTCLMSATAPDSTTTYLLVHRTSSPASIKPTHHAQSQSRSGVLMKSSFLLIHGREKDRMWSRVLHFRLRTGIQHEH